MLAKKAVARATALWQHLHWRLLASHLLVATVAITVLCCVVEVIATGYLVYPIGPHVRFWAIPLFTSAEEARRLSTLLTYALFVGGLGALTAAAATTVFVSHRIVTPVRHLMAATRRIAAGNYGERVRVTDNHEIHQLGISFNQMAADLEQTETMRQALIADVSHELRTPLTSIKGYMEGMIDGVIPTTPANLRLIFGEADRLERLVQDLHEISQLEAGLARLARTDIAVRGLLETVAGEMNPTFERKGVVLARDLPPPSVWINADSDRLKQVIINLLTNALRYTPPGGTVRLSGHAGGDGLTIGVADTGSGIAPEHLPHIFTRFYRVDKSRSRSGGGTGIGLTIARHLVEAHGGTIDAASTPGAGTTFTIHLPPSILRAPAPVAAGAAYHGTTARR
ncbi:MAG: ATP-binding protein [Chloroflexota bacterium]